MAIYLDFAGLNNLIHEPINSSTNTIGYLTSSATGEEVPDLSLMYSGLRKSLRCPDSTPAGDNYLYSLVNGLVTFPNGSGPLSTAFWLKLDVVDDQEKYIIKAIKTTPFTISYIISLYQSNKILIRLYNNSGADARWVSPSLPEELLTRWGFFVISWDTSAVETSPSLFYNDINVGDFTPLTSVPTGPNSQVLESMSLMGDNNFTNIRELKGAMMDLSIWNIDLVTETNGSELIRTSIMIEGMSDDEGNVKYDNGDGLLLYWKLGEEPELDPFSVGSQYIQGDQVPNGFGVTASHGSMILTASDNIYMAEGFSPEYNVQNCQIPIGNSPYALGGIALYHHEYLAGLNIHRNGPYGHNTFKQLRSSQNPLTRHHNKNSIFSYVLDGNTVQSNGRQVFKAKNTSIRQVQESPIITNNKPLTLVGGVSEYNRRTGRTTIERVEVQASPANEIQFFGDDQTNREFGLDFETHESYEDLTDLYLDGGIESDDSPLDQFELLRYQHQVYPREGNTYLGHVRGRPNFKSGYWRDARNDRTEVSSSERDLQNGFGFSIPSQSMWPLDVEEGWATRDLNSTIGSMTMSAPTEITWTPATALFGLAPFEDGIVLDPDLTPSSGDEIYLSFIRDVSGDLGNQDMSSYYATSVSPPTGYVIGGRYRLNSSRGVQRFYDAWTDLMDDAGFRVVDTNSSIATRGAVNITDTTFDSNDPYYLEIDNVAGAPHFTTELSHSLVHFWTKGEDAEAGHIYREIDADGAEKRIVYAAAGSGRYLADQTLLFDIIAEDGTTTDYLTASSESGGQLRYYWNKDNRGNEWNNNIISFGNPHTEGSSSLSYYSNGVLQEVDQVRDDLNFFDSDGDMNTDGVPYEQTDDIGLESNAYMKIHNASYTSDIFTGTSANFFDFNADGEFGCSFYFMQDNPNFELGTDSFQYNLIELDDGSSIASFYVKIRTGTLPFVLASAVLMDIYIKDSNGEYDKATYNITPFFDKMTKYVIRSGGATLYPFLNVYVIEELESRGLQTPVNTQTSTSDCEIWSIDTLDELQIYDNFGSPDGGDDRVVIADLVFLTGSWLSDYTVSDVVNAGATVDYTSSYWTGGEPLGWWRFNVDDEDPVILDLRDNPLSTVMENRTSTTFDLAPGLGIVFAITDGPPRQKAIPQGFHTSSIGEAYVLCATSSTNNSSTAYYQNAKIAEFALIPSQSNTDISEYASSPFYQFVDLTSSAVTTTASVWYAFDSATDSIYQNGAAAINQNTTLSTFALNGTYSSALTFPSIDSDGLVITGSTSNEIEFKISHAYMASNTSSLGAASTGILNYVSSSITGDITNLYIGGAQGYNALLGPGVLMNSYNSFNISPIPESDATELDTYLSAACLYTRRHTLMSQSTFQHPFVSTNYNSFFLPGLDDYETFELYQGMAFWDAPSQSGKKPFYDTYGAYAADMRLTNKDFSVIPEFKISDHVDKFLLKGDTEFSDEDSPMLEVTGGHIDKWNSDLDGFYETYSTTDFLKMFDLIQEEHEDFVSPISLKLKCKGVKKFLPYKGFYPADRTVEISQQFYSSYGDYLTVSSSYDPTSTDYAVQNLLTPLFSPGILFNTIKSGVACDYPIMTGSFATSSVDDPLDPGTPLSGTSTINEQFHKRIPFEALIEPEKYLANQPLYPQEPDPLGNLDMSVTWNGGGDEKYRLMVSNFLAETGDFFLKNKDFASISSLPEGDPNFGNAEAGKTYAMRIKMYRTISGDKDLWETDSSIDYNSPQPQGGFSVPQDTGSMEQAFMMYSRPSAFGPPQRLHVSGATADDITLRFTNWSSFKRANSIDTFYDVNEAVTVTVHGGNPSVPASPFEDLQVDSTNEHYLLGNDAYKGYNYPFTAPYYHGEAWADVTFQANNTEKLTLSQIINSSSVEFLRFYEPVPDHAESGDFSNWRLINEDAMQIASSVNIFSKGVLKQDITQTRRRGIRNDVQVQVDTNIGNQYRWIIQSKYETPILNFKKYTHNSSDVTMPFGSPDTTPIGMWHQHGEIPQSPNEGIFLQVTDVPSEWIDNAMGAKSYQTGSLVELCGFSTDPVRLGEIAATKTIKEAVVAVPFIEQEGQRRFFTIDREDIQNALEPSTSNLVGKTVLDMVQRIKDYVMPPSMDFINNEDIDPFAMYVFEFKHTLNKQDLADMWQNLPPDIGISHEESEAVISHELLSHELLGGKADLKPGRNTEFELNRQVRKDKIDSKIRWMVFKVKQRGKRNYFEKIFARNESQESGAKLKKTTLSSVGDSKKIGYNWPYDYFSLVELIKLDAEIDFARPDDENQEEKLVIKPYTKVISNSVNQAILNNALFGSTLPEPKLPEGVFQEPIPRGKKKK